MTFLDLGVNYCSETRLITSLFLGRGDVELEEDDVAVEDDVRLAFLAVLPLVLALLLGPQLLERVEAHNLGADEPALEVGVNGARCLGRLEPLANAPAFDFVGARGEEVNEVNGAERRLYDLRQHRGHLLVFLELRFAVIWSVLELALEPAGEGDDLSASVPLHPLVNLDQPLVLLACVVLRRQVDEVDDRFRGEQHVGVEVVHVNGAPLVHAVANLLALLEPGDDLVHRSHLCLVRFGRHRILRHFVSVFAQLLADAAHVLQVLDAELRGDDGDVLHWVHAVLHVDHVRVFERAHYVHDAVHRLDVRQKGVAEPCARGRTLDQTGDVHDLQEGLHHGLWLVMVHEPIKSFVRHVHAR
mmetsp:Transcript_1362/g.3017  ORF Transcript_1362/g.3017 Transcript_1362/m.3017 type:complete len:358 (-) Transcript_1362:346-1419(-)